MNSDTITLMMLWGKPGSAVTSVDDLVVGLDRSHFRVLFAYLAGPGEDTNHLEEMGFPVFYLSGIDRLNAFRPSILCKLIRLLRREKVDLIHSHTHKATFYASLAGIVVRRPGVLAHVHGLNRTARGHRKMTNLFTLWRVNRFLPVAEAVRRDLVGHNLFLPECRATVMENSIDYARFAEVSCDRAEVRRSMQVPENAFVFGMVGRLAATKGVDYLIRAFAEAQREIPQAHLVLIGTGERQPYEQLASQCGCLAGMHFLGFREDVSKLYRGMDAFVLSSVAEGMPRAILEAMAAGTPCVATRVGGVPEIVVDGQTGILAEPADAASLARAMMKTARLDAKEKTAMVRRAMEMVRTKYSHAVVREKLRRIYEQEHTKRHPHAGRHPGGKDASS
ncbi:MAG: glycosyltransferase [Sedimentisphaerales bacterium]|nr:glycosyltransferase [Sedimentisphaerales bacterium]